MALINFLPLRGGGGGGGGGGKDGSTAEGGARAICSKFSSPFSTPCGSDASCPIFMGRRKKKQTREWLCENVTYETFPTANNTHCVNLPDTNLPDQLIFFGGRAIVKCGLHTAI